MGGHQYWYWKSIMEKCEVPLNGGGLKSGWSQMSGYGVVVSSWIWSLIVATNAGEMIDFYHKYIKRRDIFMFLHNGVHGSKNVPTCPIQACMYLGYYMYVASKSSIIIIVVGVKWGRIWQAVCSFNQINRNLDLCPINFFWGPINLFFLRPMGSFFE
jgi:hypothetical protein